MDKVGLVVLEGLGTQEPLLHHEFVRYLQVVEDQVKHLDVIAVGFTVVVAELIGRELPVAHNDQWMFFCVFTCPLCFGRQKAAER